MRGDGAGQAGRVNYFGTYQLSADLFAVPVPSSAKPVPSSYPFAPFSLSFRGERTRETPKMSSKGLLLFQDDREKTPLYATEVARFGNSNVGIPPLAYFMPSISLSLYYNDI
jgi:hypothetical protein